MEGGGEKVAADRQIANGDEQKYPNFIGNYPKSLPHNAIGEATPSAYQAFLNGAHQGIFGLNQEKTAG